MATVSTNINQQARKISKTQHKNNQRNEAQIIMRC